MVRIAIGAPTHRISDRLYGVFFEDLNHGADGGLNANMVNNYSFDGVYVEHNRLRPRGDERWRTKADPLRFWHFEGVDAVSLGTAIRDRHGRMVPTPASKSASASTPASAQRSDARNESAPIHVNSRFVRIAAGAGFGDSGSYLDGAGSSGPAVSPGFSGSGTAMPSGPSISTGASGLFGPSIARIENLGYNGGAEHADEPAMAIKPGHDYVFEAYVRSVAYSGSLAISVVDADGRPLTETAHVTIAQGGDPGDVHDAVAADGSPVVPSGGSHAAHASATAADDAATVADPLCRNGWFKVRRVLKALNADSPSVPISSASVSSARVSPASASTMPVPSVSVSPVIASSGSTPVPARYGKLRIDISGDCVFDLDCVSLMDADHWGAGDPKWRFGKLRRDLVEAIASLRPRFMRFPGGCIVEGITPGNEYNWKDTIGALPARKQQYSMWGFKMPDESSYSQSYQIGFYEYFCLCEDLGAKPLPTLSAGINCQSPGRDPRHVPIDSDYFRETIVGNYLDLIEFANGDPATSRWARIRAGMGHPEPFDLDMIGVGNENYGPDYMAKFDAISAAIHRRYPNMLCVMSAGLFPFKLPMSRAWNHARAIAAAAVAAGSADEMAARTSAVGTSEAGANEVGNDRPGALAAVDSATGDAVLVDEHSYHSPEWFASQAHRFDDYPRDGAGVYFGEYSANGYFAAQPQDLPHANQWRSALGEAAFLTGCERNGDVVRMTSYAPLLALVGGRQWNHNLIEFNPETVAPTVNAQVERLFAANVGGMAYAVDVERSPRDKDASVVDSRGVIAAMMARRTRRGAGMTAAAVMGAVGAGLARGASSGLGVVGRGLGRLKDAAADVPVIGDATEAMGAVGDGVAGVVAGVRDAIAGGRGGKHVDRDDKDEDELIGRSLFVSVTGDDGRSPDGGVVGARRFVKIVNTGDQVIDTRIDFADTFDAELAGAPIRVAISTIDGDAHAKNQLGWHGEGVPGAEESWRAFTLRAGAERGFALALRSRSVTLIELNA